MKQLFIVLSLLFLLTSCGSSKTTTSRTRTTARVKDISASKMDRIINQAQSFAGTRYKFGGTTRKGMDCSGLIYIAFQKENIVLPRISRQMAERGQPIKDKDISKGDLLFFRTNKSSKRINHVGLVTKVTSDDIYFIHATTSKGVLTSNLNERYWNNAYIMARRVL
ncbi:NlpC/P60 family protein [Dokdonia sp. Hel_I_63]|uniref:C40 family peptidase n=1 Tax=Dokdonia sp. Hel_I_63 TaxID=1249996 RepID=UPI0011990E25|nr:C40 family peptidase [Dokdonia sp. Hel_I_63]TVZ22179.1 NlpC/P60 family protein [Dokdonia sp. Hel_I_63]